MARIFRHPDVNDPFVECDYHALTEEDIEQIVEQYEIGRVIVLTGLQLTFDREFIASLQFPVIREFKKFKSVQFLRDHKANGPISASLLDEVFNGESARYSYFAEQVESVNEQADNVLARLFPRYRPISQLSTWRLTETVNENLHVDVYREDIPEHHLRLFANLDCVPRQWHISHSLEYLLEHNLTALEPEFLSTASPGRICQALNTAVFKGPEIAGREGCPKHIVFFDPGEVWLVDSRKVSHQIVYGRKALSTEHPIHRSSMNDESTHYFDLVNRYRDRALEERAG